MKHALLRLGWLITTQIEPEQVKRQSFSAAQLKSWTDIAHKEYDNNCLLLLNAYMGIRNQTELRSFFHRYQSSLVILLNRVHVYKVMHPDSPLVGLYDALINTLEDLLQYIKDNYREHFNQEGQVPYIYQQAAKAQLWDEWEDLRKLMERHQVPAELIELALKPIGHFIECRRPNELSNRFLRYIRMLNEELTEWANSSFDNAEWELLSLLIYLNLNSRGVRAYCRKYFGDRINGLAGAKAKLHQLERYYNTVHIMPTDKDVAFNPKAPALQQYIKEWLMAEINMLSKMEVEAGNQLAVAGGKAMKAAEKLKTPFTVIEEAVWWVGLMKVGKVLNKNMIEVFRAVAGIFESKQQGEMSAESMQKHYKEIDVNSLDMMMGVAMDLYNHFKSLRNGISG